jgi:hypothetical protein
MNNFPLNSLHEQFTQAFTSHTYLAPNQNNNLITLISTSTKIIRLAAVFKLATQQIEENLQQKNLTDNEIQQLSLLLEDGQAMYARYTKATNSWSRWFLKGLARLTPELLKSFLPACFSNGMEKAEKETEAEYEKYQALIRAKMTLPFPVVQKDPKVEQEEDIPLANFIIAPSKEDSEKACQKTIASSLDIIRNGLQCIDQFAQQPLSLQKYISVIIRLANATREIMKLGPGAQILLQELGIKEKIFEALQDRDFTSALDSGNHQKIADLLQSTPWHDSFTEAMAQQGHIKFGLRKVAGQQALMLANGERRPVKEGEFQQYRGVVHLTIVDTNLLSEAEELVRFLDKHQSCRPCTIVIQMKDDLPLTPEFFQLLLKFKALLSEIKIEGVQEINFKTLALSEADEHLFIQHLETFQFPNLKSVILSDHPKKDWTAKDFSRLLAFCPTHDLLKESYALCPSYQDIIIPSKLTTSKEINFKGFALDQIRYLLSLYTELTHADLSGLPMTDTQLLHWIQQGFLANVKTLQLNDCQNLTTDSLPMLATLPQLAKVSLPDLPKGKLPLNQLPKFDNPFKIKMFYTTSKATHPLASDLYTGPHLWAPIFQIPLARQGVAKIFAPSQERLDPKSVAYWLHQSDYQHLQPQASIRTILADSNAKLTDANLVEFMEKFPEAETLSLYNCPNVSDKGIICMLQACPKIKTIDLTGCPRITDSLFLEEGYFAILNQLDKLIIIDTGISSDIATIFKEGMDNKIVFEETTLTISDNDLTDDDSVEKILQAQNDLTKLKRINLEDCTKLNNKMLGQLLDHLNAPLWIQTKEGTWVDNPQRLNLAVLNLKGCSNITDEAFEQPRQVEMMHADNILDQIEKHKIEPKLLENLDRIVIGGTQISEVLKQVYPEITFQAFEEPITIQIDEEAQLKDCIAYHEKKAHHMLDEEEQKELKKLTAHYLHNRMVAELFCEHQDLAQEIFNQPIQPDAEEFCDLILTFQENDNADPCLFHAHRDALYCQSLYFANGFRPGGSMSKNGGLDFINVHATPKATQAVMDLLYGKSGIESLDWKTAADVAELVGPNNFDLAPEIYEALLARIHSQFSIDRASEMLEAAQTLGDEGGKHEYEDTLLAYLATPGAIDDEYVFQTLANLGQGYGLDRLNMQVQNIQTDKTRNMISQELAEQANEDAQFIQEMLQAHMLVQFV